MASSVVLDLRVSILGIRITMHGSMPSSGLLVCNHLSYLDIVVLRLDSSRAYLWLNAMGPHGRCLVGWRMQPERFLSIASGDCRARKL